MGGGAEQGTLEEWLSDPSLPSLLTRPCSVHPAVDVPLPPFHPVSFPLFSAWLNRPRVSWPSLPRYIFTSWSRVRWEGGSSLPAKVSAGHIKAHKSLVCRRTLNHQSEVVCKSDFKWVCDYLGTWAHGEVAKRVWDKAKASQREGKCISLHCFLNLVRKKIEQGLKVVRAVAPIKAKKAV